MSSLLVALTLIVFVTGCSKAPETELNLCNESINKAQMAEAEQYAAETYQQAIDSLNSAKTEIQAQESKFSLFRGYSKSKEILASAQKLADQSVAEAVQNKERIRVEDSTQIVMVTGLLAKADSAIASAPRGKGTKADIELFKSELAYTNQVFQTCLTDYTAGKYLAVQSQLATIENKLNTLLGDIQAARDKISGNK